MQPNESSSEIVETKKEFIKPRLDTLQPGEHLVTVIHKHLFGIILLYLEAVFGVAALFSLIFIITPDIFNELSPSTYNLIMAGIVLAVSLLTLVLLIATYVYRQNKLLVTDKSIVQVIQNGLFIRKVSRLSMSSVEDVSVEQNGFLPTIFNYGTLTIETAGEQRNFVFPFCPNPNKYAEQILEARQKFSQQIPPPPG